MKSVQVNQQALEIQQEAYKIWDHNNRTGTIVLATGIGKTNIALYAILHTQLNSKILFLSERLNREKGVKDTSIFFTKNIAKTKNPFELHDVTFSTYQSAHKWKNTEWDLVICDEIHDGATGVYSDFFTNNTYKSILGLTATPDNNTKYKIEGKEYTKRDMINKISPIIFEYGLSEGVESGVTRKSSIYIIEHKLDYKDTSVIKITDNFSTTEGASYEYWEKRYNKIYELCDLQKRFPNPSEKIELKRIAMKRAQLLYKLPSKEVLCKQIIRHLKGKTILFANSLELCKAVTKNTVGGTISYSDKLIEAFNEGEINIIASAKLLQQGSNLVGLDNCVIASYSSSSGPTIQRIGRLRRSETKGTIVFIVTKNTKEEVWMESILEEFKGYEINRINHVKQITL